MKNSWDIPEISPKYKQQYLDFWLHLYFMEASHNHPYPQKKKNDPTNPTRLIALTSCSCKTLERMFNLRLTRFLETNNFLSNELTGFRTKRTETHKLVRIETLIWKAFIKKEHLVAVLFGLEKADDTS